MSFQQFLLEFNYDDPGDVTGQDWREIINLLKERNFRKQPHNALSMIDIVNSIGEKLSFLEILNLRLVNSLYENVHIYWLNQHSRDFRIRNNLERTEYLRYIFSRCNNLLCYIGDIDCYEDSHLEILSNCVIATLASRSYNILDLTPYIQNLTKINLPSDFPVDIINFDELPNLKTVYINRIYHCHDCIDQFPNVEELHIGYRMRIQSLEIVDSFRKLTRCKHLDLHIEASDNIFRYFIEVINDSKIEKLTIHYNDLYSHFFSELNPDINLTISSNIFVVRASTFYQHFSHINILTIDMKLSDGTIAGLLPFYDNVAIIKFSDRKWFERQNNERSLLIYTKTKPFRFLKYKSPDNFSSKSFNSLVVNELLPCCFCSYINHLTIVNYEGELEKLENVENIDHLTLIVKRKYLYKFHSFINTIDFEFPVEILC